MQCSCRIPQNPAANDLEAVQHLTSVRKNVLCQALFFALQQCREERGAVAGQGVGFQMEKSAFNLGLGGYLHFWSKRSRSDRTWDVVCLIRFCLLGNRRVSGCLWCSLAGSLYSKGQNAAMCICCSSDTFQLNKSNFWEPGLALSDMRGKERKWDSVWL